MFLTITDDHSGMIMLQRQLADADHLNCDAYAAEYCDYEGLELAPSDGRIPTGCADFTVELADEPLSAVCWTAQSYFVERGEYL